MDKITINQMVQNTIEQHGSESALSYKADKKYQDISYTTLAERIKHFCLGLTELGLQKGDRVALLSEKPSGVGNNRPSNTCRRWGYCANVFNADVRTGGVYRQGFRGKDPLPI